MTYLKDGETYASRLDDLLTDLRKTPSSEHQARSHARLAAEAAIVVELVKLDANKPVELTAEFDHVVEPQGHTFLPTRIAHVRDSLAFDVHGAEPTPRLPEEQTPTTDLAPEVDFDEETNEADDLDPTDPDLADFAPRNPGKAETPPETALSKAKKAATKKGTKSA